MFWAFGMAFFKFFVQKSRIFCRDGQEVTKYKLFDKHNGNATEVCSADEFARLYKCPFLHDHDYRSPEHWWLQLEKWKGNAEIKHAPLESI